MKDVKQLFSQNITKLNMKTSSFLEINKLNTYIASIEKEIEDKKRAMADLICAQWEAEGSLPQEKILELLEQIREKKALIEEQRQKIVEIEESQKKILGTQERETAVTGAVDETGKEWIYCTECGSPNAKGNNFCRKCGSRLEQ